MYVSNILSVVIGKLAALSLPYPINRIVNASYARAYGIDTSEIEWPLESYKSLADFFVRRLKTNARQIQTGVVSPVDGTLRNEGLIPEGQMIQAKGKYYNAQALLGESDFAKRFNGGYFFNFYLSPRDYHHVHSPVGGVILRRAYIPGRLWPVTNWSVGSVPDLFCRNERVITYIESALGLVAVVMVGATNVGKMTLSYDTLVTNKLNQSWRDIDILNFKIPPAIDAGDRVGTFNLGSTVILLFEPGRIRSADLAIKFPAPVKFGQTIGQAG